MTMETVYVYSEFESFDVNVFNTRQGLIHCLKIKGVFDLKPSDVESVALYKKLKKGEYLPVNTVIILDNEEFGIFIKIVMVDKIEEPDYGFDSE